MIKYLRLLFSILMLTIAGSTALAQTDYGAMQTSNMGLTADSPVYTVAQAKLLPQNSQVYVKGIVAKKNALEDGTITYWISDDGTETNMLQIPNGKNLNNTAFVRSNELLKRDQVLVYGNISEGETTNWLQDSYLTSLTHPSYYYSLDGGMTKEPLTYNEGDRLATGLVPMTTDQTITIYESYGTESYTQYGSTSTDGPKVISFENQDYNLLQKNGYGFKASVNGNFTVVVYQSDDTGNFTMDLRGFNRPEYYLVYDNNQRVQMTFNDVPYAYEITSFYMQKGKEFWLERQDGQTIGQLTTINEYNHFLNVEFGGGNMTMDASGQFKITFFTGTESTGMRLNVEPVSGTWTESSTVSYYIGSDTSEGNALFGSEPMQKLDDGTYSKTFTLTQEILDEIGTLGFNLYDSDDVVYGTNSDQTVISNNYCTDIQLEENGIHRFSISQPSTYTIVFDPVTLKMNIIITETSAVEYYLTGGVNGYGPFNLTKMTYNAQTGAYEAEVEIGSRDNNSIISIVDRTANNYDEWSNVQYFGINDSNYEDNITYVVTANNTVLQLENQGNDIRVLRFFVPGTYKISLGSDLKLTVTWPEGVSDKYYVRNGDVTEEIALTNDGSYAYQMRVLKKDLKYVTNYLFEIVSGDGHIYAAQGDNTLISETNCQNLPMVRGTRSNKFKVNEHGIYTLRFNPETSQLTVDHTKNYSLGYILSFTRIDGSNDYTASWTVTDEDLQVSGGAVSNYIVEPEFNYYYGTAETPLELTSSVQNMGLRCFSSDDYDNFFIWDSFMANNVFKATTPGKYIFTLNLDDPENPTISVTIVTGTEKSYYLTYAESGEDVSVKFLQTDTNKYMVTADPGTISGFAFKQEYNTTTVYGHPNDNLELNRYNSTNVQLQAGGVDFILSNHNDIPLTFFIDDSSGTPVLTVTGWPEPIYYIETDRQSADELMNVAEPLPKNDDGTYSRTVTVPQEFIDGGNVLAFSFFDVTCGRKYIGTTEGVFIGESESYEIPVSLDAPNRIVIISPGTYNIIFDPTAMTVQVEKQTQEFYVTGGVNGWNPENMTKMTYNAQTGAYEMDLEIGSSDGANFVAIVDKKVSSWSEWGDLQYFGVQNSNSNYEDTYIMTANEPTVQLKDMGNVARVLRFFVPGTYKLSLGSDLKLTVTWPEGVSDMYYVRHGGVTKEIELNNDGAYTYQMTVLKKDLKYVTDYSFEIISGDGHIYAAQGDNTLISETNCQNLPMVRGTRSNLFKVNEHGIYTLRFNPETSQLTVDHTKNYSLGYILTFSRIDGSNNYTASWTVTDETIQTAGGEVSTYIVEPEFNYYYGTAETPLKLTSNVQNMGLRCFSYDDYDNFFNWDSFMANNVFKITTPGEYTFTLNLEDPENPTLSVTTSNSYVLGDVNGDGEVDITDYIGVANYIHGHGTDEFIFEAGDIDGNGEIDIVDYIGVSNIIHTGSPSVSNQTGAKAAVFMPEESQELDPE